jgi:hypothetical protein
MMTTEHRHPNYMEIVNAITKNLVDFGYSTLTPDEVLASYDKAMTGEKPKNIIDMMTRSQLEKNGLLDI